MKIKAFAKINWGLSIVGQREDGYHELDTLMQGISIYDQLSWQREAMNSFSCSDAQLEALDSNLVLRAINVYYQEANIHEEKGAIWLEKNIPMMAGLGGGSSDAAAMLHLLQEEFHALDQEKLEQIALSVGADVPYCLQKGALMRCRGIGERMELIEGAREYPLLLVQPNKGISTKQLFESLSQKNKINISIDEVIEAVVHDDFSSISRTIQNELLPPAKYIVPQIGEIIEQMYQMDARFATMSGSGSCCFGVFETMQAAQQAQKQFYDVWFCECATTLLSPQYEE